MRLNAALRGMRMVVRGVVFSRPSREVENMAARKEDRSRSGKAVCKASEGGTKGRDMK